MGVHPSRRIQQGGEIGNGHDHDQMAAAQAHAGRVRAVDGSNWMQFGRCFLLSTASLSVLGYEHNLSQPVIRLWDDTRHLGP